MSSIVLSIEGNIGSGKSTLLARMKKKYKGLNVVYVDEPVETWQNIKDDKENILEKFYRDTKKYAFSFQMLAYISRLSMLKKCIKKNPNSVIITERSILTDRNVFAKMLHDDKMIEDIEYQIYLKWFDEFAEDVHVDGIIYVNTEPRICDKRIKIRKRSGEDIPFDYLSRCHSYHDKWLKNIDLPIYVLEGNKDITVDKLCLDEWVKGIADFFKIVD